MNVENESASGSENGTAYGTAACTDEGLTNAMTTIVEDIVYTNEEEFIAQDEYIEDGKPAAEIEEVVAENEEFVAENEEFVAENEEFVAEIEEFVAENEEFVAENEEFVAENEGFVAENEEFIADNEEFIADNEELIIEDEIIAEEEVLSKDEELASEDNNFNKQVWTSSSSKTRLPSNSEHEFNSSQNNKNFFIDLHRGVISFETYKCSKQEQKIEENTLETCCLMFDDEGNEKIVPILQVESFKEHKSYSDFAEFFHSRFSDYETPGKRECMDPQLKDILSSTLCDPKIKDETHDSIATHKNDHEKQHTVKYQCDQCDKSYEKRVGLRKHMKKHCFDSQCYCPHCGYMTADKGALKAHIKRHQGLKPYFCTQCDYKTDNNCNLKRHGRIHIGDKPLFCRECDFRCADPSALRVHIKRHRGDKPHKCPLCDYRCLDKIVMLRHIMIHTGEKPYHCFFCNFKCIRFDKLLIHLKRYDGSQMVCGFCPFESTNVLEFNHHLRFNHREDWETPIVSNELFKAIATVENAALDLETFKTMHKT